MITSIVPLHPLRNAQVEVRHQKASTLMLPPGNCFWFNRGFSLIELVMSLAIFAFAIIGIIGLLPIGLQAHRDAKFATIQSQIHQRLAAEVLLTDFSKLQDLDGALRYFDEEGVEVFGASTAQRPIIYTAKIAVATSAFPSAYTPDSIRKVTFFAIHDPAQKGIPPTAQPTGSILVAKTAPSA